MGFWIGVGMLGLLVLALVGASGLQSVPVSEQRRRLGAVIGLYPSNGRITFTADVAASTTLSNVTDFSGLQVGMTVSGLGLTAGQTIVAMDSAANTITLSAAGGGVHAGATITASWVATSAKIHLFKAPYAGGVDPTPADFTEADFDTYAAIDLPVPAGPYTNPDGSSQADFGDFSWVLFADPVVSNTVYGYWIDYLYPAGGATRVVSTWETFPQTKDMSVTGDAVVCSVPITLPDPSAATQP